MSMRKTVIMDRLDDKETKGCFRYGFTSGDAGLATLYLRKENIDGMAPMQIQVVITDV